MISDSCCWRLSGRPHALVFIVSVFALTTTVTTATDYFDKDRKPGGPGCGLEAAGYGPGIHRVKIHVDGLKRFFTLFVPTTYQPKLEMPFWLLGPGAYETPARFLHVSGMAMFAQEKGFAFVVMEGHTIEGLNVGLHGQALHYLPDDVSYTRAILRTVSSKLCINTKRIRCAGYSRGARFCSRLASELSNFVTGMAPVAGIRFPTPSNATQAMPIIAFHGTEDRINPYWGHGDPSYWNTSVPDAVQQWADFNGCKYQRWRKETEHVLLNEHFDCSDDASVVLVMIQGDGHTWAGSYAFVEAQFGRTTNEKTANEVIWNFFGNHPVPSRCHTAQPGELCHSAVTQAMTDGLSEHPEFEGELTSDSCFEDVQKVLHYGILADCPAPCAPVVLVDDAGVGEHQWSPPTTTRPTALRSTISTGAEERTEHTSSTVFLYSRVAHWASAPHSTSVLVYAASGFLVSCCLIVFALAAYSFTFRRGGGDLTWRESFSLLEAPALVATEERTCRVSRAHSADREEQTM